MANYILRVTSANTTKNIPISRLMALRTETGAKYAILESNGQLAQGITLSQKGTTLTVEAGSQKLVYLNGYYAPGTNASIETASGMAASSSSVASAPAIASEPITTSSAASSTPATESTAASATSSSGSSGGWMSGISGLGGNTGMLLLGGVAVAGIAAAAAGGGGGSDNKSNGSNNGGGSNSTDGPTITAISVSSTDASNNYLVKDDVVRITLTMSKNTVVTGEPTIKLNVGGTEVDAKYVSGSGSNTLVFNYTILENQIDNDGVSVTAGTINLANGATLKDSSGNNAVLIYSAVPANSAYKVDAIIPTINSVAISSAAPSDSVLGVNDNVTFDVTFSEAVIVTGTPQLKLMIGTTEVHANFLSGNNSNILKFSYNIPQGLSDTDGISISANSLTLNSGTITDASGHAANLNHVALVDNPIYKVDAIPANVLSLSPAATLFQSPDDATAGVYLKDVQPKSIALGTTGASVLVWSAETTHNSYEIWMQKLDSTGGKVGTPVKIATNTTTSVSDGDAINVISLGSNGNFAVTWDQFTSTFGKREIFVQRFDSNLQQLGQTFKTDAFSSVFGEDSEPQISTIKNDGSYVLVWDGFDTKLNTPNEWTKRSIFVQRFDKDGNPEGTITTLKAQTNQANEDNFSPTVSKLNDTGAFAVAWDGQVTGQGEKIFVQRFTDAGGLDGAPIQLAAPDSSVTGQNSINPIITPLSNKEMVITWTGKFQNGNSELAVFVQKISSTGEKSGNTTVLTTNKTPTNANDDAPDVTVLTDNSFVVSWQGFNSAGGKSIYLQAFNNDGTRKTTSPIELNVEGVPAAAADNINPQILALANGGFVVTWSGRDFSLNGADYSIQVQQFNNNAETTGLSRVTLETPNMSTGDDLLPQLQAVGSASSYLITWQGTARDGYPAVYSQQFNSNGTASFSYGNTITAQGGSISVQASETGTAYLVAKHLSVNTVADITSIQQSHFWSQKSISEVNTATSFALGELAAGSYRLYMADANQNLYQSSQEIFVSSVRSASLSGAENDTNGVLNQNDRIFATIQLAGDATLSNTSNMTLDLKIGDKKVTAQYISDALQNGNREIRFGYTIQSDENDVNGIGVIGDSFRGGSVTQNSVEIPRLFTTVSDNTSYTVDNTAPSPSIVGSTTIGKGSNIQVDSTEPGTIYLIKSSTTFTNINQFVASADATKVDLIGSGFTTSISTTDLNTGTYKLYASDKVGNLSAASSQLVTISSAQSVVFDLIEGVSSSVNGSRVFDANTTYTIYIRVDSSAASLSNDGVKANSTSTWGMWSGANNLGTDDKVILVGNGTTVNDKADHDVARIALDQTNDNFYWLETTLTNGINNFAFKLGGNGAVTRQWNGNSGKLDLWNGTWNDPNFQKPTAQVLLNNLPSSVLNLV